MKENAIKYFKKGYSCSESIVQAAIDEGYIKEDILNIATPFSGGMGVRCLCGVIAGSQMIIGAMYGKNKDNDGMKARELAKEFNERFNKKYKANCCKILSAGYDFHSPERKNHCLKLVEYGSEILENMLSQKNNFIKN